MQLDLSPRAVLLVGALAAVLLAVVIWRSGALDAGVSDAPVPVESASGELEGAGAGLANAQAAEASIRSTLPAIDAYFADSGTYENISAAALRERYDAGIPSIVTFHNVTATTYCVEATVGGVRYFKDGLDPAIALGSCPGRAN